jgi:hypothetical protein
MGTTAVGISAFIDVVTPATVVGEKKTIVALAAVGTRLVDTGLCTATVAGGAFVFIDAVTTIFCDDKATVATAHVRTR